MKKKRFFNGELILFTVIFGVLLILLIVLGSVYFSNVIKLQTTKNADVSIYYLIGALYLSIVLFIAFIMVTAYIIRYKFLKLKDEKKENLTNLTISLAKPSEIAEIASLYDLVIDYILEHGNLPCWQKGVYPALESVSNAVSERTMFVVRHGEKAVGAYDLSTHTNGDYSMGRWKSELNDGEFLVVHSLAVHPDYQRKELATNMVEFAINFAKESGYKSVRADVTLLNAPAMRLFEKCGFTPAGVFDLGRNVKGASRFQLYEKVIEN